MLFADDFLFGVGALIAALAAAFVSVWTAVRTPHTVAAQVDAKIGVVADGVAEASQRVHSAAVRVAGVADRVQTSTLRQTEAMQEIVAPVVNGQREAMLARIAFLEHALRDALKPGERP